MVKSENESTTYTKTTHYTLDAEAGTIMRVSGAGGTWTAGATLSVDYDWVDLSTVTAADVAGTSAAGTGVWAMLGAEGDLRVRPALLCAPGYSHHVTRDLDNRISGAPVGSALESVGDRLRSRFFVDAPGTTDQDAFDYRDLLSSRRGYVIDPHVKALADGIAVAEPASARACGAVARHDRTGRWFDSPSNKPVRGVLGLGRAIDFSLDNPAARSNVLNSKAVSTIVRAGGGYRLWGSRSTSTDPRYVFWNVGRIVGSHRPGAGPATPVGGRSRHRQALFRAGGRRGHGLLARPDQCRRAPGRAMRAR